MLIIISIPEDAKCLLKAGQNVDFDTPFLEYKTAIEVDINISKKIGIEPNKIFNFLKKFVGEKVCKGEILAVKKGLFATNKVICDQDGVIKEINHYEGTLIIKVFKDNKNINLAYFKGDITDINKNEVILKVKDGEEINLKKVSADFGGETFYYINDNLNTHDVADKIVICKEINSYAQSKSEALGARALITLIKPNDLSNIPQAQVKEIEDFNKIIQHKNPYCLVNKKSSKLYLYH